MNRRDFLKATGIIAATPFLPSCVLKEPIRYPVARTHGSPIHLDYDTKTIHITTNEPMSVSEFYMRVMNEMDDENIIFI